MKTLKVPQIFANTPLSLIFKFIIFIALIFIIACNDKQIVKTQNFDYSNASDNQKTSGRTINSFEIKNRKVTDKFSGVSKDEAFSAAEKAYYQEFGKKSFGDVVICERLMFWSVIYEDTGDEYSINKENQENHNTNSELKYRKRKLPVPIENSSSSKNISKEQAEIIAENKFESYLKSIDGGENEFDLVMPIACEMKKTWRIYLVEKAAWNTGVYANSDLPDYLIDKNTGEVLYDSKNLKDNNH